MTCGNPKCTHPDCVEERTTGEDHAKQAEGGEAQWIACSERMPDAEQEVLTWDGDILVGQRRSGAKRDVGRFQHYTQDEGWSATHWMPLPKPPGQESRAAAREVELPEREPCPRCYGDKADPAASPRAPCMECGGSGYERDAARAEGRGEESLDDMIDDYAADIGELRRDEVINVKKLRDALGGMRPSGGYTLVDEVCGLLRVTRDQRDAAWAELRAMRNPPVGAVAALSEALKTIKEERDHWKAKAEGLAEALAFCGPVQAALHSQTITDGEARAAQPAADVPSNMAYSRLTSDQRLDLIELLDEFRKEGQPRNNWQLGKYADKIEALLGMDQPPAAGGDAAADRALTERVALAIKRAIRIPTPLSLSDIEDMARAALAATRLGGGGERT